MPVSAGNLRTASFADLWRTTPVFDDLRDPKLGGRCGACEFSKTCGGCRCRAYATYGDYRERLQAIPSFARGMVVKAIETYARSHGHAVITSSLMAEIREKMVW